MSPPNSSSWPGLIQPFSAHAGALREIAEALPVDFPQFLKGGSDVGLLLLQLFYDLADTLGHERSLLRPPFAMFAIEIKDVLNLGERKADGLRSQEKLEPHPFSPRINPGAVHARRR